MKKISLIILLLVICLTTYPQITSIPSILATHNLLSTTHGDTVAASPVRGDLLIGNSTPAWSKLAIGAPNTLLHGGTDPSYSNAVAADFGSSILARTGLNNATSSTGAPTFSSTADYLAYQVAEMPSFVTVCSAGGTGCSATPGDFTTSGVGTALELITGLSWTLPAATTITVPFSCHIIYHQNSSAVVVNFGVQDATTAPTQFNATITQYTSATAFTAANLVALASTTATGIGSGVAPSAITTNWNTDINGFIEHPGGSASVFSIRVSTATAGDTVTIKRGSFCRVN